VFWHRRYDAFVSYSHKDEHVVKPMVEMLSLNERKVFWDRKLEAGDRWDDVIRSSVKRSSIFVLFWCCDTHTSDYVSKEVALALRLKKKIVPVKLCHAAMPQPLNDWQWIDLQNRVQHECGGVDHAHPGMPFTEGLPSRSGPPKKVLTGWALAGLTCLTAAMLLWTPRLMKHPGVQSMPSLNAPAGVNTSGDVSRIPRNAIRVPKGYVVIEPPVDSPGTITELDKRGRWVATHGIPLLLPSPSLPELRETPLPTWYVQRGPLLWISGTIALAALLITVILKRRQRTQQTVTLTLGFLRQFESEPKL
jgi:hypothetical protein